MRNNIGLGLVCALLAAGAGCKSSGDCGGSNPGPDCDLRTHDGGSVDGGQTVDTASYSGVVIDPDPTAGLFLSLAMDPAGEPAIAHYKKNSASSYTLRLSRRGGGAWTTEDLPGLVLDEAYGCALAFDPQGNPAIAFLGGGNDSTIDARWGKVSDAMLARKSGGAWTVSAVATLSNEAPSLAVGTGVTVDNSGEVVGLWPALAFAADGTLHYAYRDIHFGASADDFLKSNLEYAFGTGAYTRQIIAAETSNPASGWPVVAGAGTYTRMVLDGNATPAVAFSTGPAGAGGASDLWFGRRVSTTSPGWKPVKVFAGETLDGPALAWNAATGYGISFYDAAADNLKFAESADGATWTVGVLDTMGGPGRGSSIAAQSSGDLAVAYAFCGNTPVDPTCVPDSDETRTLRRLGGAWGQPEQVDPEQADRTQVAFDARGLPAVAYHTPQGGLKFAQHK